MKKIIIPLILVVVLMPLSAGFSGKQEETTISKTFYAKSKIEALEIADKYLTNDWDRISISKTIWRSDKDQGYKYEINVIKYYRD